MSITGAETPRERLLARQVNLLRHLTDPRAFNEGTPGAGLASMDAERLRLIGRMSLSKRMDKIRTALPRTFTYVPHIECLSEREFASRFPPYSIIRYDNARQFVDYVRHLWDERPMEPAFLPDLASVEAAIVKVNAILPEPDDLQPDKSAVPLFRVARNVELLVCRHDVQVFFAVDAGREPPVERSIRLLVAASGSQTPRICEISPKVHNLLRASAGWRRMDLPEIEADLELPGLIGTLIKMQIIEVAQ